jgi:hypothetical protein
MYRTITADKPLPVLLGTAASTEHRTRRGRRHRDTLWWPALRARRDRQAAGGAALDWLELGRSNLITVRAAADYDLHELGWHLAAALWPLFLLHDH